MTAQEHREGALVRILLVSRDSVVIILGEASD